jgi:hypothetical protein
MKRPRCPRRPRLPGLRASATAAVLSVAAWAAGCATPSPMIEPAFQQRSYTPARIALLPPTVFMVFDELGDNDPAKSMQLGQAVTQQTVALIAGELRRRGYDVNLQARWDGIFDSGGQLLVPGNELAWLANSIVQFANSETGGGQGPMKAPAMIAPDLARKVGWATQSDALMYVNMKGVAVSGGKRTAQIVGVVFFVVVIAAIVALLMSQSKGGGRNDVPGGSSAGGPRAVPRAGGATAGVPAGGAALAGGAGRPTSAIPMGAAPVGRGRAYAPSGGGHVYRAAPGPRFHTGVSVGVMVPLNSDTHTHEGQVADDDETFAGDEIRVSMTLVSAHDGRVLWHIRDSVDVAPNKPHEVEQFVRKYVDLIPPSLAPGAAPQAAAAPTAP